MQKISGRVMYLKSCRKGQHERKLIGVHDIDEDLRKWRQKGILINIIRDIPCPICHITFTIMDWNLFIAKRKIKEHLVCFCCMNVFPFPRVYKKNNRFIIKEWHIKPEPMQLSEFEKASDE
jgi:hypothetical protein